MMNFIKIINYLDITIQNLYFDLKMVKNPKNQPMRLKSSSKSNKLKPKTY